MNERKRDLSKCPYQAAGLAAERAEELWISQEGDALDGLEVHPSDTLPQAMGRAAVDAYKTATQGLSK